MSPANWWKLTRLAVPPSWVNRGDGLWCCESARQKSYLAHSERINHAFGAASILVCSILRTRCASYISSRSEEHTTELQSLMRISYAVFCLKKKNNKHKYIK